MKHLLFGALGAALMLTSAAVAIAAEQAGDPQAGFEYAHTYCATCHGISEEKARTINKFIKASGHRVQSQIQGDQLRVSSKSRDDLQSVIQALKDEDFGIPLQFTNYR